MSLDLCCSSTLYRLSISLAAHFKDKIAFFASVITGVKRCGILLYCVNSTLLGSIIINFKFSVEFLNSKELIIACIVTDFPLPAVPAIKRRGNIAKHHHERFFRSVVFTLRQERRHPIRRFYYVWYLNTNQRFSWYRGLYSDWVSRKGKF